MKPFSRSGKGFVFTVEAIFSLLVLSGFFVALSSLGQADLSGALLYQQASDIAQLAMHDGSVEARDCEHIGELGRALGLKVSVSTDDEVVCPAEVRHFVVIRRTLVTDELDFVDVYFIVGK